MHRCVEQFYLSETVWHISDSESPWDGCIIEDIATIRNGPRDEEPIN